MPRRLFVMSGNFDDPPATDPDIDPDTLWLPPDSVLRDILRDRQPSDPVISPSGELYRAIARFHRTREAAQARAQAEGNNQEMSSEREQTGSEQERRHQNRAHGAWRRTHSQTEESPLFVLPPTPPPPASLNPRERGTSARRPGPNSRRAGISRTRIREELARWNPDRQDDSTSNGLNDLRNAGRQLEAASSTLRALLDDPVPNISSPTLEPEEYHNHRAKRRRLDTDKIDSGFVGFRYGKYGQVEPGKLKMEIVSCDGGIFQQTGGDYSAENVLRNDTTVYCTKSNRCNLVLRHQGSTVFSLKELVIKAPHSGYTAPVQEGMVFISMTSDDLLTRTAQYQIQYSPARSGRARSPASELPPIISIRHNGDGTMTAAQARARRLYDIGLQDEECDFRTAQIPADFTNNAPPFQVTTECSDSEGDDDTRAPSRTRNIHRLIGINIDESDSSGDEERWNDDFLLGRRQRETASNITLAEAAEASQIATQEAVRAVGGELMAPHARFFIERDKSKCTVRFDPPVSGRFILLKMWSPHHSPTGNIDIQSVVAKGFAGPRYFPAVELC